MGNRRKQTNYIQSRYTVLYNYHYYDSRTNAIKLTRNTK